MLNILFLFLSACQTPAPAPAPIAAPAPTPAAPVAAPVAAPAAGLALPAALVGKAEVLAPTDPAYARADTTAAVKPEGDGGLTEGLVVKLTADVPVYRMWSGPTKKDGRGNTNRIGQWWAYDAPSGSVSDYRHNYEVCTSWNDLTWMASCTLKKDSVVVIGPGQSVSAMTCGDATGKESYPADPTHWQVYISKAWTRLGTELDCPAETSDYEANAANIAEKK